MLKNKKLPMFLLILSVLGLSGCDKSLPKGEEYVPEDNYLFSLTYDRIVKSCPSFDKNGIKIYTCASGEVVQEVPWSYRPMSNDDGDIKTNKDGYVTGTAIKYWSQNGVEMYELFANPEEDRDIRPIYSGDQTNPALKMDVNNGDNEQPQLVPSPPNTEKQ